jgi:hypothetical protein
MNLGQWVTWVTYYGRWCLVLVDAEYGNYASFLVPIILRGFQFLEDIYTHNIKLSVRNMLSFLTFTTPFRPSVLQYDMTSF